MVNNESHNCSPKDKEIMELYELGYGVLNILSIMGLMAKR
jgi:hypothetical protein